MPTVTLNRAVFEKLAGKKLTEEKLKDRIALIGTDLESMDEKEIHVEVFPNRPDMLSEQGFGRAFKTFIGAAKGLHEFKSTPSGYKLFVESSLPKEWPYAVAFIARGLKLDAEKVREIIQLQEKLGMTLTRKRKKGGIGLYPLEKIKFPIRFKGIEPKKIRFVPLGFTKEMNALEILEHHPKGKEYGHICKSWKVFSVFVDDNNEIMSMPPLINSNTVGKIDESTTELFVEGTGPDLNVITYAINIIAASLYDMGAKIDTIEMVYDDKKVGKDGKFDVPDMAPRKMKIDYEYINRMLGLSLGKKEINGFLEQMGFGIDKTDNAAALIPAYRADILHQADLMEDVAIAYGYDNFTSEIPKVATIAEEDAEDNFIRHVSDIFVGLGFTEANTYHISNKNELVNKMDLGEKDASQVVELANALTEDYNAIRSWMLPNLLRILSENKHNEFPQNIFEIGLVARKADKRKEEKTNADTINISSLTTEETGVEEFKRLGAVICHNNADFTQAKQVIEYLLKLLQLPNEIVPVGHPSFVPGRVGRVIVKQNKNNKEGKKVAFIGEIHPKVLANFGIETPVVAFELNVSEVFEMLNNGK
ncbi:phenylalanine--tRNA ligase subunit beta [Candidatus Woesearchaeota archaeon]|nr:phenylalanine--tRNA ligase subunit beta [Candidatus Woesearchaeota archaeon]